MEVGDEQASSPNIVPRRRRSRWDQRTRWEEEPLQEAPEIFKQDYICFPISHIDKPHLQDGNRIIMPSSALERLIDTGFESPVLFEIKNPSSDRVSHCGVLEFSADEGFVLLPNWMMKNMNLREGDMVNLKNVSLPKGQFMKIQPHAMEFVRNLRDPEAVLEGVLKDFACVTVGDTIKITHQNQSYDIDIVETKPSNAILMIDTDCEVDFAPPLDYKEPEERPKTAVKWKNEKTEIAQEKTTEEEKLEPKFKAFTGVGRRLDGQTKMEMESTPLADAKHIITNESNATSQKRDSNFVFGPDNDAMKTPKKAAKKDVEKEKSSGEVKKFRPFSGKKYTLAG